MAFQPTGSRTPRKTASFPLNLPGNVRIPPLEPDSRRPPRPAFSDDVEREWRTASAEQSAWLTVLPRHPKTQADDDCSFFQSPLPGILDARDRLCIHRRHSCHTGGSKPRFSALPDRYRGRLRRGPRARCGLSSGSCRDRPRAWEWGQRTLGYRGASLHSGPWNEARRMAVHELRMREPSEEDEVCGTISFEPDDVDTQSACIQLRRIWIYTTLSQKQSSGETWVTRLMARRTGLDETVLDIVTARTGNKWIVVEVREVYRVRT